MQTSISKSGVQPASGVITARISKIIYKLSTAAGAVKAYKAHAWRAVTATGVPAVILFAGRFSATGASSDFAALAVSSLAVLFAIGAALSDHD